MILITLTFDVLLVVTLIGLAWQALASKELFTGVVLFIAFGLLMALAWVRLSAIDIALAEAALGAGLTGALLLSALGHISTPGRHEVTPAQDEKGLHDDDQTR